MQRHERGVGGSGQYEYLLFGSVSEANLEALLHRLRGLCDYAATGGIPFKERELTYKIGGRSFLFLTSLSLPPLSCVRRFV